MKIKGGTKSLKGRKSKTIKEISKVNLMKIRKKLKENVSRKRKLYKKRDG
jgi:hypothetical protein